MVEQWCGKEIGELQYGEQDLENKKCRIAIKVAEIDYQGTCTILFLWRRYLILLNHEGGVQ